MIWKDKWMSNLEFRECVCKGRCERLSSEFEEANYELNMFKNQSKAWHEIEDEGLEAKSTKWWFED